MYEGQDKNPEMCRVLLTHEVMCRYVYIIFRMFNIVGVNLAGEIYRFIDTSCAECRRFIHLHGKRKLSRSFYNTSDSE